MRRLRRGEPGVLRICSPAGAIAACCMAAAALLAGLSPAGAQCAQTAKPKVVITHFSKMTVEYIAHDYDVAVIPSVDLPAGTSIRASAKGRNVGKYPVSVRLYDSSGADVTADYELVLPKDTIGLVINPDTAHRVTIKADPKSVAFGSSAKLTATVSGMIPGDEKGVQYTLSREAGDKAGTYSITVGNYSSDSRNYADVTAVNGAYTINPVVRYAYDGDVPDGAPALPGRQVISYNVPFSLRNVPEGPAGYVFSGWASPSASASAGGEYVVKAGRNAPSTVVFTGSWEPVRLKVNWFIDGELYMSTAASPGDALNALSPPEKEGYEFTGWTGLPGSMPSSDISVEGGYRRVSFTVTFMLNGLPYRVETRAEGEELPRIGDPPMQEGYYFEGWDYSSAPAVMGSFDVVITGSSRAGTQRTGGRGFAVLNPVFFLIGLFVHVSCALRGSGPAVSPASLAPSAVGFAVLVASTGWSGSMTIADAWTPLMGMLCASQVFLAPVRIRGEVKRAAGMRMITGRSASAGGGEERSGESQ